MTRFYIDGKPAGDPLAQNIINLYQMRTVHLGYSGRDLVKCNCDMAEVEIYSDVLTEQEIFDSYSRHITGPNCPNN